MYPPPKLQPPHRVCPVFNSSSTSSGVWWGKQESVTVSLYKGWSFLPTFQNSWSGWFPQSKNVVVMLNQNIHHKRITISQSWMALWHSVLEHGIKSLILFLEKGSMIRSFLEFMRGGHCHEYSIPATSREMAFCTVQQLVATPSVIMAGVLTSGCRRRQEWRWQNIINGSRAQILRGWSFLVCNELGKKRDLEAF